MWRAVDPTYLGTPTATAIRPSVGDAHHSLENRMYNDTGKRVCGPRVKAWLLGSLNGRATDLLAHVLWSWRGVFPTKEYLEAGDSMPPSFSGLWPRGTCTA